MRTYQLWVKVDGRWEWQADIAAETHPAALRQAIAMLRPAHYDKPIRLEQVEPGHPPDFDPVAGAGR